MCFLMEIRQKFKMNRQQTTYKKDFNKKSLLKYWISEGFKNLIFTAKNLYKLEAYIYTCLNFGKFMCKYTFFGSYIEEVHST